MENNEILADDLHRYLFTIAYRMLGEREEARDVVQEVSLRWLELQRDEISNPKAYLAKAVVNYSINRLGELKRLRESYTGFWLPEPVLEELPTSSAGDPLDYGLMVMLEKLSPRERAVFILRHSFDYSYHELHEITGDTEDNCRQLLHRAKEKLSGPVRFSADAETHRKLLEAFLFAVHNQDRSMLEQILRDDIVFYGDGGGKRQAALKPIHGADKVIKFFLAVTELNKNIELEYQPVFTGAEPAAFLLYASTGEADSAVMIDFDGAKISAVYIIRNPDKLQQVRSKK